MFARQAALWGTILSLNPNDKRNTMITVRIHDSRGEAEASFENTNLAANQAALALK